VEGVVAVPQSKHVWLIRPKLPARGEQATRNGVNPCEDYLTHAGSQATTGT
jgi:hypothetical protein